LGGASVIYHIFRILGIIWLTIFAQKAFNAGQKTLAPYIVGIGLVVVVLIAIFYNIYLNNGNGLFRSLSDLLFGVYTIISSLWQFETSRKAYSKMKNLRIEPYIKKRYEFFQYSALFLVLTGIFGGCVAFAYDSILTVIIFLFVSLSSLGYLILNFLIWVMPPVFKEWLNRGFISTESDVSIENTEENLSEEDIMAKFMEGDT